jgi:molybdopterin synthase catalytic subunit
MEPICLMVTEAINTAALSRQVADNADGALTTFAGMVRNHHRQRPVDHLEYHAYPEMALAELQRLARDLMVRHAVNGMALVHRTGRLAVGELSVFIAVAAPHRQPALACCAEAIEVIKQRLPVWKKEFFADGGEPEWVYGPDELCAGKPEAGHAQGRSTDV